MGSCIAQRWRRVNVRGKHLGLRVAFAPNPDCASVSRETGRDATNLRTERSSKKLVKQALSILAGGDFETALALLANINRGFLRKRLNHYLDYGDTHLRRTRRQPRTKRHRVSRELCPRWLTIYFTTCFT